jgi:hypothetical protein
MNIAFRYSVFVSITLLCLHSFALSNTIKPADGQRKVTAPFIFSGIIVESESQKTTKSCVKMSGNLKRDTLATSIHTLWHDLLLKHVSDEGFVDYRGFQSDLPVLEEYLRILKENIPGEADTKAQKLAYWINVYNAFTIKLILDNYPLKSIKDIKKPWKQRFFQLGDKWYSLNEVEHKILRKMNEPRIHFAIVCASVSCPKLQNKAFEGHQLEEQLENATRTFVNDPTKNKITSEVLALSLIFKWFTKDFASKGGLLPFLKSYVDKELNEDIKISYQVYNWQLNGM